MASKFPPLWSLRWYSVAVKYTYTLFSFLSFCVGGGLRFGPDFLVWIFVSFDGVQIVDDDDDGGGGGSLSMILCFFLLALFVYMAHYGHINLLVGLCFSD